LTAVPAPSVIVATDLTTEDAMKSAGAADIFQHFDQIESAQAATRPAAAPSNPARPLAGLVPGSEPFRQKMLEMFDKNNDGRLDDAERAEARKYAESHGLGEGGPAAREQMIKRFDKNGDGKLDAAETAEMRKFLQAQRSASKAANPAAAKQAKLDQVAADLAQRRAESLERAKKNEQ
jgi:hypothetical protein